MGKSRTASKPITPGRADIRLRTIRKVDLDIVRLEAALSNQLAEVKGRYTNDLGPLRRKRQRLLERLVTACQKARRHLFPDDSQTLKLGSGQISWRTSPPSIQIPDDVPEEETSEELPRALRRYVRVKRSLDRQALRKETRIRTRMVQMVSTISQTRR